MSLGILGDTKIKSTTQGTYNHVCMIEQNSLITYETSEINMLLILHNSYILHSITRISMKTVSPANWRVQAAILTCNTGSLLIINSYFPCDDEAIRYAII